MFLTLGIVLLGVSCETTSVAEENDYYETLTKDIFDEIKPMGPVTPANIRKPGGNKNNQ